MFACRPLSILEIRIEGIWSEENEQFLLDLNNDIGVAIFFATDTFLCDGTFKTPQGPTTNFTLFFIVGLYWKANNKVSTNISFKNYRKKISKNFGIFFILKP